MDIVALHQLFLSITNDRAAASRLFTDVVPLIQQIEREETYPLVSSEDEDDEIRVMRWFREACATYLGQPIVYCDPLMLSYPLLFLKCLPKEADEHTIDKELKGEDVVSRRLAAFITEVDDGARHNEILRQLEDAGPWRQVFDLVNAGIDRRTEPLWARGRLRELFKLSVRNFLRLHAAAALSGDMEAERTRTVVQMLYQCVPLLRKPHAEMYLVVLIA